MIKVGIVGGTGYTGVELLRLLVQHPDVALEVVTSRSEQGQAVADLYPNLRGHVPLVFEEPSVEVLSRCDLVFYATPNGVAMRQAPELLARGVKVIDLAADFRIKDIAEWSRWYGMEHACPEWVEQAVYGLPELKRSAVRDAQLIANPGCYPTAVQLGLLPLMEAGLVQGPVIADCKSGTSGAGRGAKVDTLFCEVQDSFKAYGIAGHRHLPEIKQGLAEMQGTPVELTFVPHLLPQIRGIHATLYVSVPDHSVDLEALYAARYADEYFVDVLPSGQCPSTRSVRGSNFCRISVQRIQNSDQVVILSVIDNLVKGAAGQAVQNMNLMFGLDENCGLTQVALLP